MTKNNPIKNWKKTWTDISPKKTHCSISQIIREMQTNHLIQVRMAIIRKPTIFCEGVEKREPFYTVSMYACVGPSVVSDSVTPWTGAHQPPLSMGFSRQGYWGGLPFPPPDDTVARNVNWCSHYGKPCNSSRNQEQSCHMLQQSHFWAYIQRKLYFEKIHAS